MEIFLQANDLQDVKSDPNCSDAISRVMAVPDIPNQTSIDLADARNQFYQITVSSNKTITLLNSLEQFIMKRNGKSFLYIVIPIVPISAKVESCCKSDELCFQ